MPTNTSKPELTPEQKAEKEFEHYIPAFMEGVQEERFKGYGSLRQLRLWVPHAMRETGEASIC